MIIRNYVCIPLDYQDHSDFFSEAFKFIHDLEAAYLPLATALALFSNVSDDTRTCSFNSRILVGDEASLEFESERAKVSSSMFWKSAH